ncbi:MAG: hypothetical protein ACN2B6_11455 [Rickettsiales bacterium]
MKRNRPKGKERKGGADYWKKMESARVYQANISFMDATVDMPSDFRIRFAWEIIKGVNPITGKQHIRPYGVRWNLGMRGKAKK